MASLLIRGARVYDHDGDVHQPAVADVLVEGDRIRAVGEEATLARAAPERTIDARRKLLVPGFVNAHYHSYDLLAKGLFEDLPLDIWRQYTARLGAKRPLGEVRLRTLVGALECLRNGITTVQDMSIQAYHPAIADTMLEAYEAAGLRVVFSVSVRDLSDADTMPYVRELFPPEVLKLVGDRGDDADAVMAFVRSLIERHGGGDTLHWALSPSAPHRCTPRLLQNIGALAAELDLPIYTHLYEAKAHALHARQRYGGDGGSLVRYLDRVGLLGPSLTVAHALWSRPDELDLLAERGARVVVNLASNFKLKDGVPPIDAYRRAGVELAFGCDCFSCSDAQNLFQSMKLACLLAAARPGPARLTAADTVRIATAGGAATAGLPAGHVRPGMKADLVLLDLDDPAFVPFNSAARQLVFSETGRAVNTVIVNGRVIIEDGRATTLDEAALREQLAALMPAYLDDYRRAMRDAAPLVPWFAEQARRVDTEDVGIDRFL